MTLQQVKLSKATARNFYVYKLKSRRTNETKEGDVIITYVDERRKSRNPSRHTKLTIWYPYNTTEKVKTNTIKTPDGKTCKIKNRKVTTQRQSWWVMDTLIIWPIKKVRLINHVQSSLRPKKWKVTFTFTIKIPEGNTNQDFSCWWKRSTSR